MKTPLVSVSKSYYVQRWIFSLGNILAWVTVLVTRSSPKYHWLQGPGYLAAIVFSGADLVVLGLQRRSNRLESRKGSSDTAASDFGSSGGAAQ
jgi:hypothetical protein